MKNINACMTSNSIHWATPKNLYDFFMRFGFVDPCPLAYVGNNLHKDYKNTYLYINPPFKDLDLWVDAILSWVENHCFVVLLMPVRTDTQYFKKLFDSHYIQKLVFFTGRLHFNGSIKPAPFPTMLVYVLKHKVLCPSTYVCSLDQYISDGIY